MSSQHDYVFTNGYLKQRLTRALLISLSKLKTLHKLCEQSDPETIYKEHNGEGQQQPHRSSTVTTTPPTDEAAPPTDEATPVDNNATIHEPQATDKAQENAHQHYVSAPTEIEATLQRIEIMVDEINEQLTRIKAYDRYMEDRKRKLAPNETNMKSKKPKTTGAATANPTIKGTKRRCEKDSGPSKQSSPPEQGPSQIAAVPSKNCASCNGPHYFTACRSYFTLTQREERARALQKCIRCLKDAIHIATACPSTAACYHCKTAGRLADTFKHHATFCEHQFRM
ncbi:unnamed protein product [Heligmosomoides polygyrus]|uniref:TAZ-type domain-containing protein n=1 Tax=Heligmosomoides polygyrus TaxID=6339 RepID=A0A183GTC0_HELPZ|nr:unnamed protein product [Heligmosomoides polygyrus]